MPLEESPDVEAALVSPVFPADIKKTVIKEIIKALSVEAALANFLQLLVERGRRQAGDFTDRGRSRYNWRYSRPCRRYGSGWQYQEPATEYQRIHRKG